MSFRACSIGCLTLSLVNTPSTYELTFSICFMHRILPAVYHKKKLFKAARVAWLKSFLKAALTLRSLFRSITTNRSVYCYSQSIIFINIIIVTIIIIIIVIIIIKKLLSSSSLLFHYCYIFFSETSL